MSVCCYYYNILTSKHMSKISRADARAANLISYFTGNPCSRGHVAWRYVSSGGCSQCVADDKGKSRAIERRKAPRSGTLIEVAVRAYDPDVQLLRDTAEALSRSKYPNLRVGASLPPRARAAGTAVITLRVPAEFEGLMRETADSMLASHRVDVVAHRARILRAASQMAEEQGVYPE